MPEAIDFFEQHTKVVFTYREKAPDYKTGLPGAKLGGRAILPSDADIRMLGERRKELQPYLSSYTVFGYMPQVGPDMATTLKANQSVKAFTYTASKLLQTWVDTALFQQPMKRTNGSALMTRMVAPSLAADTSPGKRSVRGEGCPRRWGERCGETQHPRLRQIFDDFVKKP